MTPPLPAAAALLRLLDGLLAQAATHAGFASAHVLVADESRGILLPLPGTVSTSTPRRVRSDCPPVRGALNSSDAVHASGRSLSGTGLDRPGVARASLLRLSGEGEAPARLLVLTDADSTAEFTVQQRTALTAVRTLLDDAATTVLDAEEYKRRWRDLEQSRKFAAERALVDERLDDAATAGDCMSAIVRACSALAGKSVLLFDRRGRTIAAATPDTGGHVAAPALTDILRAHSAGTVTAPDPVVLAAGPTTGLTRRKIVTPVIERGEHFGWLVIDEHPAPLSPTDEYAAARSARRIGAQFLVQRRIARVAWNARSSLTRQLVRGTGALDDLATSGEYLGVNIHAQRVLVYVLASLHDLAHSERVLAERMERDLGVEVLSTRGSEGILLLVEARENTGAFATVARVKDALARAANALFRTQEFVAGVSSVCEPTALARAYRESREAVRCIDRFTDRTFHRILAVDDLGPARLFLAHGEISAVRHFVDDVLGPLLRGAPGTVDLLHTLQCWFDTARNVRGSAQRLGVHENTVRLRLARVHALTGLDVAGDASDQLSVQTALLVLRLQGHPALEHLDDNGTAPEADPESAEVQQHDRPASRGGPAKDRRSA
ncbi:PucR family transcriptional regulator [Rhodococcus ruber]|uniref:PucR family transcriptional regulator n=1 Tax=Rhodococcus ruber TaxID=1830 RepID=UPI001D18C954|nr:helix-turn-helix domain-containing protein [Rhodococcus ruber]